MLILWNRSAIALGGKPAEICATLVKTIIQKEVRHAVNRLNTRPRKALNFRAPYDLMSEYRAELLA